MKTISEWLKKGNYLPGFMRDFHDQKDLFKAIHDTVDVKGHQYAGTIDWATGHCYVVDIFLWFMAKRGYTLQKSRERFPFKDIQESVSASKKIREQCLAEIFKNGGTENP